MAGSYKNKTPGLVLAVLGPGGRQLPRPVLHPRPRQVQPHQQRRGVAQGEAAAVLQGPGPDGLIVQVQRGLGVLELEVEQGLVPVQVEAEGGALPPLGSSVAQEPRALRHCSSFS